MTRLLLTNNTERKQMSERAVILDGEISRFLPLKSLNEKTLHTALHFCRIKQALVFITGTDKINFTP